jgi:hypothetical protein
MASLVRYTPPPGAPEWDQGAASMANDPLDPSWYNAAIRFSVRQGSNQAALKLAPRVAFLAATRPIRSGEEIFFNYGSEKPFRGDMFQLRVREAVSRTS